MFLRLAASGKSLLEITEIADTMVRDRIENVEGVSGIDLMGAQVYAIRIELDRAQMATRGVTLADVEAALKAGNVEVPAGRIEGTATQLTIHVDGGLATPDEFGGLLVRADGAGRVYLRDVAAIRMGAENERASARADGVPSVSIAITPQAQANIIQVSDEVRRRLVDIGASLPAGMSLEIGYDRADAVRASIHDVELTLGVAFVLVVVVIFAFLRDWRSTLVPTLAIPVSIVGTFLVLWAAGFTINVFTLFGLVLAIGLVVDDAIVVLENIVRRIEEGETPFEAALAGTRQIAMAVVATTLSLVAVFLPVIFTGGATGRLFLEFGTTVAASVAISAVVALSLTPMLSSVLLRATHNTPAHAPAPAHAAPSRGGFARSLAFVLRRPWVILPVLAAALVAVVAGYQGLPREFFPTEDRNIFMVRTQAQEGTSFAWMDARMKEVEQELMPLVPERQMMLARVASGPGGVSAGTNTGMIVFPLTPRSARDRSQQEIVASLKGALSQITAFRTIPVQFPTVGRGFSSPLQFVLQNADFDALTAELPKFVKAMREVPGLSSVNEDLRLDRPELWVHVDREKAAELGVPIRDVAATLQVLTSGLEVSTFKRGVRQYKVFASLPADQRATPGDLGAIDVRARNGAMVPLANLLRTDERAGPAARYHYNRAPSATISANVDGITLGEGIERVKAMAAKELPPGFRTALAGESRDFAESTSSLAVVFLLALALVYLLLAAQFDSFVAPISIMLAVPLALGGAFAALWTCGMTLSFFGQVGLVLLVGLVTKNGILIVEYAGQLRREQGLDAWAAAEEATRLRFRPILMTSVATIGGALPIAFGLSGESRASLGVAVTGGMLSATLLTLYVTPVVYAALAGRRKVSPVSAVAAEG
jgi:multidrug efflux pump